MFIKVRILPLRFHQAGKFVYIKKVMFQVILT